jgi:hypothetical protein
MFKFSSIVSLISHLFTGTIKKLFASDAGTAIESAVVAFVKTDIGLLDLDAVQYASAIPQSGKSNVELRDAAKAKLAADLKAAGHDLSTIGESMLNLFIEMAYTYASGLVKNLSVGALVAAAV